MKQTLGTVAKGSGSTAVTLVAAVLIAAGVPLAWVWIASKLAGTEQDLTPSLALFITTGILVSYWVVLLIGSAVRRHWVSEKEERTRLRRMSWNRSFRDEPYRPNTDPVEVAFVVTALLAIVAFEIWFFFFAGSPLPNQPMF